MRIDIQHKKTGSNWELIKQFWYFCGILKYIAESFYMSESVYFWILIILMTREHIYTQMHAWISHDYLNFTMKDKEKTLVKSKTKNQYYIYPDNCQDIL